ncbi:hypothetical protein BD408DRAFT_433789 [Parasitella parasitica]|nr:hypothetical protein BD408DRAFT_433789 [Parasitella parasitica]
MVSSAKESNGALQGLKNSATGCGFVTDLASLYSGEGYVVLAAQQDIPKLPHRVEWAYRPLDYSSTNDSLTTNLD